MAHDAGSRAAVPSGVRVHHDVTFLGRRPWCSLAALALSETVQVGYGSCALERSRNDESSVPRPTPAVVVSVIAPSMAVGGTGDAVITLHADSAGNKQLKNGAVATKKIARNAVTSAKVKRNSLTGADIRESTLAQVRNAPHAAADSATSTGSANTVNLAGEEGR